MTLDATPLDERRGQMSSAPEQFKREKLTGEIHEIVRLCVAMAGGVATLDFTQEVNRIIELSEKWRQACDR
jgi:hypothetical protein